ncbi:hypothetical protein A8C75_06750 [Marinobacterium aestuarii]|uniref:Type III-B CRISPR module-associated protein Cmr3 n=1 Tax=Marinobacterium aestuarii TaxID=1821621 RepID=A0A1A9EXF8_9GAMM|nr:type III-B CRISPR module-associated Cmr3 family protein [Marinobacterium aestuarii]ANG62219.1 hypothetical protein A8C75_06750 [Marinobacterium aestuarii]
MNKTLEIRFTPIDTWFFRDARPHDTAGASRLSSLFPPPVATLTGAIRTRLGEALGIDWKQHVRSENDLLGAQSVGDINLSELIGYGDNSGLLRFGPSTLLYHGEPLYPVPAYLLNTGDDRLVRLQPGSPILCDLSRPDAEGRLGAVVLPTLPEGIQNAKPLESCWTTGAGLLRLLNGDVPAKGDLKKAEELFVLEPRLGIARDNSRATVVEGLLYQTEHLRLLDPVSISLTLTLPAAAADQLISQIKADSIQRLGGEGRMASLSVEIISEPRPVALKASAKTRGLILTLLSPARLPGSCATQPLPGFSVAFATDGSGLQTWQGSIAGIKMRLVTAVTGKVQRTGGWDLQRRAPKDVVSLMPAGSSWFAEIDDTRTDRLTAAVQALHGQAIGEQTGFGYGQLACGLWQSN